MVLFSVDNADKTPCRPPTKKQKTDLDESSGERRGGKRSTGTPKATDRPEKADTGKGEAGSLLVAEKKSLYTV